MQPNLELWIAPAQGRQRLWQEIGGHGWNHSEPQGSRQWPGQAAGQVNEFTACRQDATRERQQGLSGGGEKHRALAALEQLDAQQPFEVLELGAQAGLGDKTGVGRRPEAQPFGHGHKIFQLPEGYIHR